MNLENDFEEIRPSKEVQEFEFEQQVFFYIESTKAAQAWVIRGASSITSGRANKLIQNFMKHNSCVEDEINAKLIGPLRVIEALYRDIKNFSFKELKKVPRLGIFVVQWRSKERKIRLSANIEDSTNIAVIKNVPRKDKIKLLIVDDSPVMQKILKTLIGKDPQIEIVAIVGNPLEVEDAISKYRPDVMTLDVVMPHMSGVELLKKIHHKYKIPTIMLTSLGEDQGGPVMEALQNGALDYIQKTEYSEMEAVSAITIEKIKELANANLDTRVFQSQKPLVFSEESLKGMIFIGASTGGTQAIDKILKRFPSQIPPIMIVQHMLPQYTKNFADLLAKSCKFPVVEAKHDDQIVPNKVYIAAGGKQMKMMSRGIKYFLEINNDPPLNRFQPSIDYFFQSIPVQFKGAAVAVILTGMGSDGANGLLKLKESGVTTIAQDKDSCVVFGMPKCAIELGATDHILDLDEIADKINSIANNWKK
jgi:two-component system chemotaxis response regulator CheB